MSPDEARENLQQLRPGVAHLRALQRQCRPFGSDYAALAVSLAALDECAEVLTGEPSPFGASGNHR